MSPCVPLGACRTRESHSTSINHRPPKSQASAARCTALPHPCPARCACRTPPAELSAHGVGIAAFTLCGMRTPGIYRARKRHSTRTTNAARPNRRRAQCAVQHCYAHVLCDVHVKHHPPDARAVWRMVWALPRSRSAECVSPGACRARKPHNARDKRRPQDSRAAKSAQTYEMNVLGFVSPSIRAPPFSAASFSISSMGPKCRALVGQEATQ